MTRLLELQQQLADSAQTDGCVIVDRAFLSGATNFLDASIEFQQNSPEEPPDYRTQFDVQLAQLVDELRHILAAAPTPPEQVAQPVDERVRFEIAFSEIYEPHEFSRSLNDDYINPSLHDAWIGWRAALQREGSDE